MGTEHVLPETRKVTSLDVEVTLDLFVINNIGTAGQVLARYQYV